MVQCKMDASAYIRAHLQQTDTPHSLQHSRRGLRSPRGGGFAGIAKNIPPPFAVDFPRKMVDIIPMDIQALSMGMAQEKVIEGAAVQVQKMALGTAEQQGEALMKMIDSASVITDPELGNKINILV